MRGACVGLFIEFTDATVKEQDGRARFARGDFDVLPGDPARPACLQSFERGFFGGEARGIVHRCNCAATVAVVALALSVNTLDEARRA
ncbi:MAG: hypothetical protein QOC96_102 [Acidobacteriota bacterium]|nr:hypothetical protein [Acidobacteriota bacterium]